MLDYGPERGSMGGNGGSYLSRTAAVKRSSDKVRNLHRCI